jgi:hypothetical protein
VINSKTSVLQRRGEICSNRRRHWSDDDKGRVVAESFERGAPATMLIAGTLFYVLDNPHL